VAQEDASEAGVPLARSNFYPDLGVTGTVSAQGNNSFPNASKRSLMVTLSLPIFNGGKDYHDLKSAAAQYSASSYQRQSVDQQLLPKLKQTFRAYVEAIEKLKVDKAFLEAAEVRAEIARNKYNNGLLSFEDWDTIENDLITRQKTYLLSERDRIIAEATWELTAGKGVIP
jgi:outer membrane protein TolC